MKTHELKAALTVLRASGYLVVHWTADELAGLDRDDVNTLEEQLINYGEDFIAEHQPDEDAMCTACSGSGEGMYDGSRCSSCGGKGVVSQAMEWSE